MEHFSHISQLERNLNACVTLDPIQNSEEAWLMKVHLFYKGESAGMTSFTLNGYSADEAEHVAKNISSHASLMKEIDDYLWGESD